MAPPLGEAPYPENWEKFVTLDPVVRRCEIVMVNDQLLTQVMDRAQLREGNFLVSEAAGELLVFPHADTDMAKAKVEVSERHGLFHANGKRGVVLRGLNFQHGSTPMQGPAVSFSNCRQITVENCRFAWNNWSGMGLGNCDDVTVRGCVAVDNGAMGFSGWRLRRVLFEDCQMSRNNRWRGGLGKFYGWAVAGGKFMYVHDGVFRRIEAKDNQTNGFWLDTDCQNVVLEEANLSGNFYPGMFIESCQGPITVRKSVFAFNGSPGGVLTTTSSNVTLDSNILYGNVPTQLSMGGEATRESENFECRRNSRCRTEKWTLKDNIFVAPGATTALHTAPWEHFLTTLTSSGNLWFSPSRTDAFQVASLRVDLANWRELTGQDLDSCFADPRLRDVARGDFAVLPDSPIHERERWPKAHVAKTGAASLMALRDREIRDINERPYTLAAAAEPSRWKPIDLTAHVNHPLNGKGGWIGIPLDHVDVGERRIQGVPFRIAAVGDRSGTIAMASSQLKTMVSKSFPEQVDVPVGQTAAAVYLLHGTAWGGTWDHRPIHLHVRRRNQRAAGRGDVRPAYRPHRCHQGHRAGVQHSGLVAGLYPVREYERASGDRGGSGQTFVGRAVFVQLAMGEPPPGKGDKVRAHFFVTEQAACFVRVSHDSSRPSHVKLWHTRTVLTTSSRYPTTWSKLHLSQSVGTVKQRPAPPDTGPTISVSV